MKAFYLFASSAIALASLSAFAADAPAKFADGALLAPNGMTLYTFDKDTAGAGKSVCNGPCAGLWPPLMVTGAEALSGDYNAITRDDGTRQVAYKGKPLYFYKADSKAGDRTGDNVKDVWHIVKE
mgnify:FL=1